MNVLHAIEFSAQNFSLRLTAGAEARQDLAPLRRRAMHAVRVELEMGVVRFGTRSMNGTKVRANAS